MNNFQTDFKSFEEDYMKENEGAIISIYDRHAGLVDGMAWGRNKIIGTLLSEVLPCYMYAEEAVEVVEKLEEILDKEST